MTALDTNRGLGEREAPSEAAPHDAALLYAITRAAGTLRFDSRPGSLQRQCTIGLFVAALSDRLALALPQSAHALHEVVFGPAGIGIPSVPDESLLSDDESQLQHRQTLT